MREEVGEREREAVRPTRKRPPRACFSVTPLDFESRLLPLLLLFCLALCSRRDTFEEYYLAPDEDKREKKQSKSARERAVCKAFSQLSSSSTETERERIAFLLTHRLSLAVAVEEDDVGPPPAAAGLTEEDAVGAPPWGRRGAAFVIVVVAAFASGLPPAPPPPWRPTETASLNLALRSAGESADSARPWWSMAVFEKRFFD